MYNYCNRSEQIAFDILMREFPKAQLRKANMHEDLAGTDFFVDEISVQVKEQKTARRTGRFSFELAVKDRKKGWQYGNHYGSFTHYMMTAGCNTFYYLNWGSVQDIINTVVKDFWNKENILENIGDYAEGIIIRSLSPSVLEKQRLSKHRHTDAINICIPLATIASISQKFQAN